MINARAINVQHPKNARATISTVEARSSLPEETRKMA
jgi:hypothetical protein